MKNRYLRHTLSTIDYRFRKSIKYADKNYGQLSIGKGVRTPTEIVNHVNQVINATRIFILERRKIRVSHDIQSFDLEVLRFYEELKKLDKTFAEENLGPEFTIRLLQGPLADALTHIGQLAMLSRLNDRPIEREDFSSVPIETGLSD